MPEGHVSLQAGVYHFEYSDILAIASRWEYESLSHLHAKMPSPRDRGLPSTSTSILPLSIPIKQCQDYQLVIPPSFTFRAVTIHVRSLHSRDTNFQGIKRPSENPIGELNRSSLNWVTRYQQHPHPTDYSVNSHTAHSQSPVRQTSPNLPLYFVQGSPNLSDPSSHSNYPIFASFFHTFYHCRFPRFLVQ